MNMQMPMDWEFFKREAITLAKNRHDEEFTQYISSLTDRAWQHVFQEKSLSPDQAEQKMWSFYQEDKKNRIG